MTTTQPTPDTPGVNDPGFGRRLALDVGTARIGVAASDSMAMLATPVETVARTTPIGGDNSADIARLVAIVKEYQPAEIIVGLPRNLKGKGSASVDQAVFIAERLEAAVKDAGLTTTRDGHTLPVFRYGDERLSTVAANQALKMSGRNQKKGRAVIDQAAACEILQTWLDGRERYVARNQQM